MTGVKKGEILRLKTFLHMLELETDSCIEWPYGKQHEYGILKYEGKPWSAHRLAFHLKRGGIPEGLGVLHKCDNPPCFNPRHLFSGTHIENINDAIQKNRFARGSRVTISKLTEHTVREMRELHASGVGYRKLGKRFGIHPVTVYRALSGENWRWVQ